MQYHLGQNTLKIQHYFQFCEYTIPEQASQILMVKTNFTSIICIICTKGENKYLQILLNWVYNLTGFCII